MPRRCTVCDRPDRQAIEAALGSTSYRTVAAHYGLSATSLKRHQGSHATRAIAAIARERDELSAKALLERLLGYLETAEEGVESALKAGDRRALAALLKESRELVVTLGKTIGLWTEQRGGTVNVERMQVLAVGELTVDELRKLAALAPAPEDQR